MSTRFQRNPGFTLRSRWGGRIDPISGEEKKFHSGHDYAAKAGTPIPAEIAGEVVYSGFNERLGNTVIVKHPTGGYGLYGHMQDGDRVQVGQPVWQGEVIGRVGSTGARTTGNHVHYTLIGGSVQRENTRTGPIGVALNEGTTIDPEKYDIDPRYLHETSRAQQMTGAPKASGDAWTSESPNGLFAGRFERVDTWPPDWSVPAPLSGLPGLLMKHVIGKPQQTGPQSPESGTPAVPFVPTIPLASEDSDASFDERFKASLPVRRLSSRLPSR